MADSNRPSDAESPDMAALAAQAVDLWQAHVAAVATDAGYADIMSRVFAMAGAGPFNASGPGCGNPGDGNPGDGNPGDGGVAPDNPESGNPEAGDAGGPTGAAAGWSDHDGGRRQHDHQESRSAADRRSEDRATGRHQARTGRTQPPRRDGNRNSRSRDGSERLGSHGPDHPDLPAGAATTGIASGAGGGDVAELTQRIAELERRLAALDGHPAAQPAPARPAPDRRRPGD